MYKICVQLQDKFQPGARVGFEASRVDEVGELPSCSEPQARSDLIYPLNSPHNNPQNNDIVTLFNCNETLG